MTVIVQTCLLSLEVSDGNQWFIWQGERGIEKSTTRQWVNPEWACKFCSRTSARRIICYARILQDLIISCRDCGPIYSRCLECKCFCECQACSFFDSLDHRLLLYFHQSLHARVAFLATLHTDISVSVRWSLSISNANQLSNWRV